MSYNLTEHVLFDKKITIVDQNTQRGISYCSQWLIVFSRLQDNIYVSVSIPACLRQGFPFSDCWHSTWVEVIRDLYHCSTSLAWHSKVSALKSMLVVYPLNAFWIYKQGFFISWGSTWCRFLIHFPLFVIYRQFDILYVSWKGHSWVWTGQWKVWWKPSWLIMLYTREYCKLAFTLFNCEAFQVLFCSK